MADQNGKPVAEQVVGVRIAGEELQSLLGEGVHTGLRKGSDTENSGALHRAISELDDGCWGEALSYAIWGLRYMGYDIVKVVD